MTEDRFMLEVEKAIARSNKLLARKGKVYTVNDDRLINFKQAGAMELVPPTQSLMSMMNKHVANIAGMVKNPTAYTRKDWNRSLDDVRNYTLLLDALLIDMGVE